MEFQKSDAVKVSISSDDIELQPFKDNSEIITSENPSIGEILTEVPDSGENTEERIEDVGSQDLASPTSADAEGNPPSSSESEGIESIEKEDNTDQNRGGFTKILPSCLFDVVLPIVDVFSDLSLVIPWYLGSHWKYATSMTFPLLLQFTATIYKWIQIEKPKDKKWSWTLLLLQVWPQYRALRVIRQIYKNDPKAENKKKQLLREVSSTEPFLEAWPSILIMTIIWFQAEVGTGQINHVDIIGNIYRINRVVDNDCKNSSDINYINKNLCSVFGGFGGVYWFVATYSISMFTGALGITKFFQTGPCSVLSEEGTLGGMLRWKFILTYLAVAFSMLAKGLFIATFFQGSAYQVVFILLGIEGNPWEDDQNIYVYIVLLSMLLTSTIITNLIIAFISIGLVTGFHRKFFEIMFSYPAICFLPAITYFVMGPRQIGCCRNTHEIGLSKTLTIVNLVLTVMMYVTMITLFWFWSEESRDKRFFEIAFSSSFAPACCLSIVFTIVHCFLDKKCCCLGSQACFCIGCCGPDCYKARYQYIKVNTDNNAIEIVELHPNNEIM